MYEDNKLYLLPNHDSDTNWYKNILVAPTLKISVNSGEIHYGGKIITNNNRINNIVRKFNSKYGEVTKYYTKFDITAEVQL